MKRHILSLSLALFIAIGAIGVQALAAGGYLYDETDPWTGVKLEEKSLKTISSQLMALTLLQNTAARYSAQQLSSPSGSAVMTQFAEEVLSRSNVKACFVEDVTVDYDTLSQLEKSWSQTKPQIDNQLKVSKISKNREFFQNLVFDVSGVKKLNVTIDPSAAGTTADNIVIEAPNFQLIIPKAVIEASASDSALVISVEELSSAYKVTFSKPIRQAIKLGVAPLGSDPSFQIIAKSDGSLAGGLYNPATNRLVAHIKDSDTYAPRENKKSFSDIADKPKMMQDAIYALAAKGVISGVGADKFNPDGLITRAEAAAMIMRLLSGLDPDATADFSDVKADDWYMSAVGSAVNAGIIKGMSATAFEPMRNIQKDQLVAICARALQSEMKYALPADSGAFIGKYSDKASIPSWGHAEFALAAREGLIVSKSDGAFDASSAMTRGDAAIMLYRLFSKIC